MAIVVNENDCKAIKKRIGKDLKLTWIVTTNGVTAALEGRDLTLVLREPTGEERELDFTTSGARLSAYFYGKDQRYLGMHRIILWENFGKIGQTVVDQDAFVLVAETRLESHE